MSGRERARGRKPAASARNPSDGSRAPQVEPRKWLWFRNDVNGRRIAEDEFKELEVNGRAGLAKVIERYLARESRRKDVASIGGGIYELRYRYANSQFRVLFMLWGKHCVALTAFSKKQAETPKPDKDRANVRAARWRQIFGDAPSEDG